MGVGVGSGRLDYKTQDGYDFVLKAGPVRNLAAIMETSGAMAGGSETPGGGHNLWPDLIAHP